MSRANPTAKPINDPSKFLHVSSQVYFLPLFGEDPNVDGLIARGELLDIQVLTVRGGKDIRVGRSKGVTYRRYPKDGRDRREHRDEQFGRR